MKIICLCIFLLSGLSAFSQAIFNGASPAPAGGRTLLNVGLLAYYRFEEASGANNATDASGNSRTLTQFSGPGSGAGIINNCRTYNGGSTRFQRGDEAAMEFSGDFTISMWINLANKSFNYYLAQKLGEFQLRYDKSADRLSTTLTDQSSVNATVQANTLGPPSSVTWLFVVVRRSGNTLGISVNAGTEDTVSAASLGTIGTGNDLFVGVDQGLNFFLSGSIDEMGKWSRALSPTDIGLLYASGAGRDPVSNP